ncbi:Uncharacterised protein [Megamonas hypermegale]|uniref:DUF4376 domain-containing protein n=1 Tax=Megamonas hypermegale TaxID=158847 RepID=A0A378NSH9_9FIRM|nr:hypothetical protein [Megamonas hypermegale]STY71321.1 Uncharacterised protein [Megamonas hypermegale]
MLQKEYLIKFNQDGSRENTYANLVHYNVKIDENNIETITNIVDNFDYQKCLDEGYEWVSNDDYQKLIGNYDGQEYIKTKNGFIPKPPYEPTLEELKKNKIKQAGELFAQKRDAIRWIKVDDVNIYGFDCSSEDITNFTAAYIGLTNNLTKNNTIFYKVWLTKDTKGIVSLNIDQMTTVYNTVRNSQFENYTWYEDIKNKINNCNTKEELQSIIIE